MFVSRPNEQALREAQLPQASLLSTATVTVSLKMLITVPVCVTLLVAILVNQRHQTLVTEGARRETKHRWELVALLLILHNHCVNLLYNLRVKTSVDNLLAVLSLLNHSHKNCIYNLIWRQDVAVLLIWTKLRRWLLLDN